MKVLIEINCNNAAFDDFPGYEILRILNSAAYEIDNRMCAFHKKEDLICEHNLFDCYGNKVGELKIEE